MSNDSKVWSFKEQLEIGDAAEKAFLERYPRKLELYPGREYDFTVCSSRERLELKADNFNIKKTDNFFFERYSDVHSKKLGGPFRAEKDKVDIFCYYFVRHNIWFEFRDVPQLVKRIKKLVKPKSGLIYVKNRGWITGGYKLPRSEFEDLFDVWEFEK